MQPPFTPAATGRTFTIVELTSGAVETAGELDRWSWAGDRWSWAFNDPTGGYYIIYIYHPARLVIRFEIPAMIPL